MKFARASYGVDHLLEIDRLAFDIRLALESCIDRNEIVASAHLDSVSGIEENRYVGVVGNLFKLIDDARHFAHAKINVGFYCIEISRFKGFLQ